MKLDLKAHSNMSFTFHTSTFSQRTTFKSGGESTTTYCIICLVAQWINKHLTISN